MQTKNTKLLDEQANKDYYRRSDGHFMDIKNAFMSHKVLPRVNWVRDKVYEIGSEKHLDIGTKDGYLCLTLQSEGIDCVGVDPSEDSIDEAKLRANEAELDCKFYCSFIEDLTDEWIERNFSDTVSVLEVIEHVKDANLVMQKLCKMGMYIMVSTPDANGRHGLKDSERNEEHVRVYTQKEFEEFISKYGEIRESVIVDDQLMILFRPK
jgi:2-polyprenyl-3-methyl-5-hydroxy-6-metoxy-1,4-benzoquinol methylase